MKRLHVLWAVSALVLSGALAGQLPLPGAKEQGAEAGGVLILRSVDAVDLVQPVPVFLSSLEGVKLAFQTRGSAQACLTLHDETAKKDLRPGRGVWSNVADPVGPGPERRRSGHILRGGYWAMPAPGCHSSARNYDCANPPYSGRFNVCGLRLALGAEREQTPEVSLHPSESCWDCSAEVLRVHGTEQAYSAAGQDRGLLPLFRGHNPQCDRFSRDLQPRNGDKPGGVCLALPFR